LAKEGADVVVNDVVVNDVDLELAKKVADEVKSVGRQAQPIKADVSNSKEVDQLVKKLYCTRLAILTYGFKSGEVVNVK
jgi:NAD(P)-dependent dehydrogenase (short-subunit alcohol dehydrogenase family)